MNIPAVTFVLDFLFPSSENSNKIQSITHEQLLSSKRYNFHECYPEIYSICRYRDEMIKKLVSEVKFHGNKRCAEIIGAFMAKHIDMLFDKSRFKYCTIIPIPTTPSRKRSRGWNQCELLVLNIPAWSSNRVSVVTDFLVRQERTSFQKKLSRHERCFAQKDSFSVNLEHRLHDTLDFRNNQIFVIDDVVTTGATLHEALKTLRSYGAQNLIGCAFAH